MPRSAPRYFILAFTFIAFPLFLCYNNNLEYKSIVIFNNYLIIVYDYLVIMSRIKYDYLVTYYTYIRLRYD
nr:MAG TPA: hypothetical protein [Inoviridae sp.]